MTYKSETSNDPEKFSNLFADFFRDVYIRNEDDVDSESFQYIDRCKKINDMPTISISESTLHESLKVVKSSTRPRPDDVPSIVLKNCSVAIAKPLHLLFNQSLTEETVPDVWKLTYLWPRFKAGKRSMVENYCGIAKLTDIPKRSTICLCSTYNLNSATSIHAWQIDIY